MNPALLKRAWEMLVNPRVRLTTDFPLTGRKLGKAYLVALFWFVVGTAAPLVLFFATLFAVGYLAPESARPLLDWMVDHQGVPNVSFVMTLSVVTFLSGFGAQLWYLRRHLHLHNSTLTGAVALNLSSLRGKTWMATLWSLLWRVVVAAGIWYAIELVLAALLHPPLQPTAELAKQASGGNFIAFFLLAAVAAPILEEIVFRGFLFNALRSTFHQGRVFAWLNGNKRAADFLAVTTSAAIFSLQHMQFHPVTMLLLFLMGWYLAEVYRRTGTLWTGILLHAINNGIAVILLGMI